MQIATSNPHSNSTSRLLVYLQPKSIEATKVSPPISNPTVLVQRMLKPTAGVSDRMRQVATKGTGPERRVRKVARQLGIRYTTKTAGLPGKPDLLLPDYGIAVFVHGCFWHGCPRCYVEPRRNRLWWRQKISNNRRRDRRKADHLRRLGYSIITFREHDHDTRIRRRLCAHTA